MRDFELSDVCPEEIKWTKDYVEGEYSADDSLIDLKTGELLPVVYKLYDVPLEDRIENREEIPSYSTYFLQALVAKGNIGEKR